MRVSAVATRSLHCTLHHVGQRRQRWRVPALPPERGPHLRRAPPALAEGPCIGLAGEPPAACPSGASSTSCPADSQEDSGLWRLKTAQDFSYRPSIALSKPSEDDTHWFQRVYLGLWKPRVYLWGANENNRLAAVPGVDGFRWSTVPAPADATPSFKASAAQHPADSLASETDGDTSTDDESRERIVDLQTGGWSYTARDAKGGVWVWGELAVFGHG